MPGKGGPITEPEDPPAPTPRRPVALFDPCVGFGGVAACRPGPQLLPEQVVQAAEHLGGVLPRVVIRPAHDLGVECGHKSLDVTLGMTVNNFGEVSQMLLLLGRAWFYDGLESPPAFSRDGFYPLRICARGSPESRSPPVPPFGGECA